MSKTRRLHFEKICRLCGEESSHLMDIFDPNLDLFEKLHSVIPIAMNQKEPLPSGICAECAEDLNIAERLVRRALETNETLKKSLEYKLSDKNGPVKCDICHKTFTNMKLFDAHVEDHKKTTKELDDANPTSVLVVCSDCGFAFGNKSTYEYHKVGKNSSCQNCKISVNSQCELNRHRCRNVFKIKKPIVKGVKKVNEEYMKKREIGDETFWQCEICEKVVTTKVSLQGHLRIHTKERPYECEYCGNKFRVQSNLIQHLVTHTGTKNYACPICDKRFARKSFVTTHMRSHTGEKPYSCHICNYRFSQSGDRNRHVARHLEKENKSKIK